MFSMEFCGGATGTCPWCHLEGGLTSRGTSLMSGGRDQDSDRSGPTWTRERHHPADISKKNIDEHSLTLSLYYALKLPYLSLVACLIENLVAYCSTFLGCMLDYIYCRVLGS
jgi:hypothetical protein